MFGATLALAVVLGLPASTDADALVVQLGSNRYAQREAAEEALTRLGRGALPALRSALEARDAEIRTRATAILGRIEGALLVEPTPIAFDFRDTPIREALTLINGRSGLSLRLDPGDRTDRPLALLTLKTAEPLPFWKGLDAFCKAGRLHYAFGAPTPPDQGDATLLLSEGYVPPPDPISDSGPFRVHVSSVHNLSEIQFSQTRPTLIDREGGPSMTDPSAHAPGSVVRQFYVQMVVAAEPRLSLTQNGPVRMIAAEDDRGQSLLIPPGLATVQRSSGYFGMNPSPMARLRVDLAYPETPGKRIAKLRGLIPVIVATRKPGPLDIPLADALGKSFRNREVELAVRSSRDARDDQPQSIELTLRPLAGASTPANAAEVDAFPFRPESPQQQLEVLDARGQVLPWFPSASFYNGEETRLTMTILSRGADAVPATVRYHSILSAPAEIPFEFHDLPIP